MSSTFNQLQQAILATAPRAEEQLVKAFLLDECFSLVGATQAQWVPTDGDDDPLPFTTTVFTIAPSGAGKGFVQRPVAKLMRLANSHISAVMDERREKKESYLHSLALAKFGEGEKTEKARQTWVEANGVAHFEPIYTQIGTQQGVAKALNAMRKLEVGGFRQRLDECASVITSKNQSAIDFITTLLSFSGGIGKVGRAIAGDVQALDATGVSISLHFFGNDEEIAADARSLEAFRSFLRKGFSRRAFFFHVPKVKTLTKEMLRPAITADRGAGLQHDLLALAQWLLAEKRTVIFSGIAKDLVDEILLANAEATSERRDWYFKAQQLASMFALLERRTVATVEDVEAAYTLVKASGAAYAQLLGTVEEKALAKTETHGWQIASLLINQQRGFTQRELLRACTPNLKSAAALGPVLAEAAENLRQEGYTLEERPNEGRRGILHFAAPVRPVEELPVSFSMADTQDVKCTHYEPTQATLEELAWAAASHRYSAHVFKDNKRHGENWQSTSCLIFDVDGGEPLLEEAKAKVSAVAACILPTRNHKKEKNGVVADRYRVFVPLQQPIVVADGRETYKYVYLAVAAHLGLCIDDQCSDLARTFQASGLEHEPWFTAAGSPVVDWRDFAPIPQQKRYKRPIVAPEWRPEGLDEKGVKTLLAKSWVTGQRNILAFRVVNWLKDAGMSQVAVEHFMELHTASNPLPAKELAGIIKRAFRGR
ncbi:hypothetical protein UFOVP380_41 [uncultured Caudovirales phage]|uniref:Primase C-terminal 1 domain-containing protein n=1 Tax=uncultured Caudovirales phage TaxID=2100421 RepID=A0A6J7X2K5_9CAUD|nr:hypothetical protein UFOVP380_41 [uncultured Caudovirales phage]